MRFLSRVSVRFLHYVEAYYMQNFLLQVNNAGIIGANVDVDALKASGYGADGVSL